MTDRSRRPPATIRLISPARSVAVSAASESCSSVRATTQSTWGCPGDGRRPKGQEQKPWSSHGAVSAALKQEEPGRDKDKAQDKLRCANSSAVYSRKHRQTRRRRSNAKVDRMKDKRAEARIGGHALQDERADRHRDEGADDTCWSVLCRQCPKRVAFVAESQAGRTMPINRAPSILKRKRARNAKRRDASRRAAHGRQSTCRMIRLEGNGHLHDFDSSHGYRSPGEKPPKPNRCTDPPRS